MTYICNGCEDTFETVYDAACHSYALGAEHVTTNSKPDEPKSWREIAQTVMRMA